MASVPNDLPLYCIFFTPLPIAVVSDIGFLVIKQHPHHITNFELGAYKYVIDIWFF